MESKELEDMVGGQEGCGSSWERSKGRVIDGSFITSL